MKQYKQTLMFLSLGLATLAAGGIGCGDDAPADDPERDLAEQELEAEAKAQEQNRETREGLQDAASQLQEEQGDGGVAEAFGGEEEYEQRQEEKRQAARDAKARAAGFDTWEAYQASLNGDTSTSRPD